MTEQQNLTNAEPIREAYSAPICKRFTFETSGLIQTSGDLAGNLGNARTNVSRANADPLKGDVDW